MENYPPKTLIFTPDIHIFGDCYKALHCNVIGKAQVEGYDKSENTAVLLALVRGVAPNIIFSISYSGTGNNGPTTG